MPENTIISLVNVCKSYHDGTTHRHVLRNVNAELKRGKIIAIQGRSGSGKSTLLNLLAGIDTPESGQISINGQDIHEMTDHDRTMLRRRQIGFVFQSFNLIPTLTVKENLAFPLELNGIKQVEIETRVQDILEHFNLHDRKEHFPDQLSGGEQQRVAIARAIIHTPAIVLADEPTGNLDLETERQVLELINTLPEKYGVTVICATHSVEVAKISSDIYQLEQGQLINHESS
jgi:putative ABC transport system ATP-binding protein